MAHRAQVTIVSGAVMTVRQKGHRGGGVVMGYNGCQAVDTSTAPVEELRRIVSR
jgi:hypothetical protein